MDGIFTTDIQNVKIKDLSTILKIIPFGDIHRDSHNCDVGRWQNFLKKAKQEDDENTRYIGIGDYFDFASYSERKQFRSAKLHESTIIKFDEMIRKDVANLACEMGFMKGRIIGLISGNHEWDYMDSTNATQDLCERLQCKYLGNLTYVRLRISIASRKSVRSCIDIFAGHGKSSGKLVGTSFNRVDDMKTVAPSSDIYIMGHDHKKGAIPTSSLEFDGNHTLRPKQKRQWLVRSGSFLKGYEIESPSYIVSSISRPCDLGVVRIECGFNRDHKQGHDVIVKDIHCWS
jgi:hypothetical protein